jgi:PKD repeat protein
MRIIFTCCLYISLTFFSLFPFLHSTAAPVASFSASDTVGCLPLSIKFKNTSTSAKSFYWDFGNGNTSTLASPSNVYTISGLYTVKLITIDATGNKDSVIKPAFIRVVPVPVAQFSANDTIVCPGATIKLTNNSANSNAYIWDFGDGNSSSSTNPSHAYTASGYYTVKLIAKNAYGCSDAILKTKYIYIHPQPSTSFVVDVTEGCDTSQVFSFTNKTTSGTIYTWNFGDGNSSLSQNPTHKYATPGLYTVKLSVTNSYGCAYEKTNNNYVKVDSIKIPDFTSSGTSGCPQYKPAFKTSVSATSYNWDFGDGSASSLQNPTHIFSAGGTYTVKLKLTTSKGCTLKNEKVNYITIYDAPVPSFSVQNTKTCKYSDIGLTNTSTEAVSYSWDFGAGLRSKLKNPSHSYNHSGTYTITLTAISSHGCKATDTIVNAVTVYAPSTNFSASSTTGCNPMTVKFSDSSTSATKWHWNFGNGDSSNRQNPVYKFASLGNYDISLIAENSIGCKDTMTKSAYINVRNLPSNYMVPAPVKVCAPYTATFKDPTTGSVEWLWDFGDGTSSTDSMPTHVYKVLGTFKTSLVTKKSGGCKQYITHYKTFDIKGATAGFTSLSSKCPPFDSRFTDTSSNVKSWLWNFGDGTTSSVQNPNHTFTKAGYHSVSLTITTKDGCSNTNLQSNSIYFDDFGSSFTSTDLDTSFPKRVQFSSKTTGATGYKWDFDDTTTSTSPNPLHTFKYKRDYFITLQVWNAKCTLAIAGVVSTTKIKPPKGKGGGGGSIAVTASGGSYGQVFSCAPASVDFKDTSTNAKSWLWDFGDSSTSTTKNPTHNYTKPGNYDVKLIVTKSNGRVDTTFYKDYVMVRTPTTRFNLKQLNSCSESKVEFKDSSQNGTAYTWDFGDGDSSFTQNPSHTYTSTAKTYNINLIVTDSFGCSSSIAKTVYAGVPVPITVNKSSACYSDTLAFTCPFKNYKSYSWNFGDSSSSTAPNPKHNYSMGGTFKVKLTVTDTSGCTRTYPLSDAINIEKPIVVFTADTTKGCSSLGVNFQNTTHGTYNWYWNFGDGDISYRQNPGHTYNKSGLYSVKLTAEKKGCSATAIRSDYIRIEKPSANFSISQSVNCFPITVNFKDSSNRAKSWQWNFGDSSYSTDQNPVHTYTKAPSGKVSLNIDDSNGCSASIIKTAVHYLNSHFAAKFTQGCAPWKATFQDKSTDAVSWQWNFGDGDTSHRQNPEHVYTKEGKYNVSLVVTSSATCSDSLKLGSYLQVFKPKADFYSSDKASCAPSYITFKDTSTGASSWRWDFGDGSFSTLRNPSHIYNSPGLFTVKLYVSNKLNCTDSIIKTNYIKVLGPVPSFRAADSIACGIVKMQFTDLSKDAISWSWNFGDGNTSDDQSPAHTYTNIGKYTVSLITRDSTGCRALFTYPNKISIRPKPVASFKTIDTMGCAPYTIQCNNKSAEAINYYWNFGDGFSSVEESPVHTYDSSGDFKIYMVAKNQLGCTDTVRSGKKLHVNPSPKSEFSVNVVRGCSPLFISFTNKFHSSEPVKFHWDFGNGITSTDESPKEIFRTPGQYNIHLVTENNYGCTDTTTKKNFIEVFTAQPPVSTFIHGVTVLSDTRTMLSWDSSQVRNFGSYKVYRKNTESGYYEPIKTIAERTTTSFIDDNLNTVVNPYTYKLQVVDFCGNALPLDSLKSHTTINVSAIAKRGNVAVSWTPYKGCGIESYEVYRTQLGTADTQFIASVGHDTTSFMDTAFVCPVTYFYKIKATHLAGTDMYSWSDTATTKPENLLNLQKVDISRSTVMDDSRIFTEWKAPTIEPGKVAHYNIYRSGDNANFELLTSVPAQVLSFLDTTADVHAHSYYYKIEPINYCSIHGSEGLRSSSVFLKVDKDRPNEKLILSWTPYIDWKEGVDYYIIEKQKEDGTWESFKQVNGNTYKAEDFDK